MHTDRDTAENTTVWSKDNLDEFLHQYSDLIRRIISATLNRYGCVNNFEDQCRDVFQDVVLSLSRDNCRKLGKYKIQEGAQFSSWLKVVVARLTIDYLRQQKPAAVSIDTAENIHASRPIQPADPAPLPDGKLEYLEIFRFIKQKIEEMPVKDQLIIKLTYEDALPVQTISRIVGLSPGAIYTRLSRIKARLKDLAENQNIL